jgi:hypothetical protein
VEAEFISYEAGGDRFRGGGQADLILARPFLNVETNEEDARLITFPGLVSGSIDVAAATDFGSTAIRFRRGLSHAETSRLDLLTGVYFTHLDEALSIQESLVSTGGGTGIPVGTRIRLSDSFRIRNRFLGPQLGLANRWNHGRWIFDAVMKLAIGSTRSEIALAGSTTTTTPDGATASDANGVLVLTSNSGRFDVNKFTFVPELGVRAGIRLNRSWRGTIGYSLVYWGQVVRPGDLVDRSLNLSQLPPGPLVGAERPELDLVFADFLAEALSLGLECTF